MPASSPEEIIVFHKSSVESTCRSHTFFLLGSGACPRYNLSVPEGSSGHVEINLPKKASHLCKMPTTITASDTACDPILVFTSKGKQNYYSHTYRGRIALSGWLLVSVKNASEWMAGEYRVVSDLHEICMARINLTVPGKFPRCLALRFTANSSSVSRAQPLPPPSDVRKWCIIPRDVVQSGIVLLASLSLRSLSTVGIAFLEADGSSG